MCILAACFRKKPGGKTISAIGYWFAHTRSRTSLWHLTPWTLRLWVGPPLFRNILERDHTHGESPQCMPKPSATNRMLAYWRLPLPKFGFEIIHITGVKEYVNSKGTVPLLPAHPLTLSPSLYYSVRVLHCRKIILFLDLYKAISRKFTLISVKQFWKPYRRYCMLMTKLWPYIFHQKTLAEKHNIETSNEASRRCQSW